MSKAASSLAALSLLALTCLHPITGSTAEPVTSISIIIDDLGNSLRYGQRAIRLPGAVAYAVLPHTHFSVELAEMARARDKEVLLHLPMTSSDDKQPGPGNVDAHMPALEVAMTLEYDLETVPHAIAVNNHMGSLLTKQRQPMRRLMNVLLTRGDLFFVDSRTTADSVAGHSAKELGLPHLIRDVFLDNERNIDTIDEQFDRLLAIARENGHALAIGHPYPETLEVLERRLPGLANNGIELVSLSRLLEIKSGTAVQ